MPRADVEVEGSSHVFHETRTDVATRGLIRDLADDPGAALTVLVAQLFKQLALHTCGSLESSRGADLGDRLRPRVHAGDRLRWTARCAAAPRRSAGRLQGLGPAADHLGRDPAARREDGADGRADRHLAQPAGSAHLDPAPRALGPRRPRSPRSAAPTSPPIGRRTTPTWRSTPRSSSPRCWTRWASRTIGRRR